MWGVSSKHIVQLALQCFVCAGSTSFFLASSRAHSSRLLVPPSHWGSVCWTEHFQYAQPIGESDHSGWRPNGTAQAREAAIQGIEGWDTGSSHEQQSHSNNCICDYLCYFHTSTLSQWIVAQAEHTQPTGGERIKIKATLVHLILWHNDRLFRSTLAFPCVPPRQLSVEQYSTRSPPQQKCDYHCTRMISFMCSAFASHMSWYNMNHSSQDFYLARHILCSNLKFRSVIEQCSEEKIEQIWTNDESSK
jgi:hypothetical protein